MTRAEFLERLAKRLAPLTTAERNEALHYYEEFLDEAEDPEAAIKGLGDPDVIAERILLEAGIKPKPSKAPKETSGKTPYYKSAWFWVCMVLLAPVTIPIAIGLLGAAFGVALGILGAVLGVGAAIIAVLLALLFCGVTLPIAAFWILPADPGAFFVVFGVGLVMLVLSFAAILGLVLLIRAGHRRKKAKRAPKAPAAKSEEKSEDRPKLPEGGE
jgi:uncharacterized membrane protein